MISPRLRRHHVRRAAPALPIRRLHDTTVPFHELAHERQAHAEPAGTSPVVSWHVSPLAAQFVSEQHASTHVPSPQIPPR